MSLALATCAYAADAGDPCYSAWGAMPYASGGKGCLRGQGRTADGKFVAANTGAGSVTAGGFVVGGGTWDSTSGALNSFVIDGQGKVQSAQATGATGFPHGHAFTRIGAGAGAKDPDAANFFRGSIAEVAVYNRILTPDESSAVGQYLCRKHLQKSADSASPALPVKDGLVLHLDANNVKLVDQAVAQWPDLSGRGNHAAGGISPRVVAGATPSGGPAVRFAGEEYLDVAAAPQDFDGSARTWFVVFAAEKFDNGRLINSGYGDLAKPVEAAAAAGGLQRLKYNNPGLTVDLGVSLWGVPLPMTDAAGQVKLFVAGTSKPDNGIYRFDGDGAEPHGVVFKPGVKVSAAKTNLTMSRSVEGQRLVGNGCWYPAFPQQGIERWRKIDYTPTFYCDGRTNQWQFFDYDGDGVDDLVIGTSDWRDYGWDDAYDSQGRWTKGPLHGYVYWVKNLGTNEEPKYGQAQQVQAGGKPIDVYGTPSPCLADFDGDGLPDLICGEFVDTLTFFKNVGTRKEPKFAAGSPLKSGGAVIHMDLCMIQPTAIDWDKDGHVDLVVSQEDGRVALLRNTGKVVDGQPEFEPPVFMQQQADEMKLGVLPTPFAFDWNGDGKVDLICGDSAGHLVFFENLGGKPLRWAAARLLEADGKVIRVQAGPNGSIQGPAECKWGYTVPCVVDWDMDGLPDILVNSTWGKIEWYRNIGTRTEPKLAAAQPIEVEWPAATPKPAWNWWNPQGKALVTQWRSSVAAMDFTGDGLTDLVTLDPEGFLVLYERKKVDGKLVLLPPQRVFHVEGGAVSVFDGNHKPLVFADKAGHNELAGVDAKGNILYTSPDRSGAKKPPKIGHPTPAGGSLKGLETALRLNAGWAGASGRRKFTFVDWDGDGKIDLLVNSTNVNFLKNVSTEKGRFVFRDMGPVDAKTLAGHDTCPTTGDIYGTGVPELIVGAEDGFFYHLSDPNISPKAASGK